MNITAERLSQSPGYGSLAIWIGMRDPWWIGTGILIATLLATAALVIVLYRQKRGLAKALKQARQNSWNLQAVVSHEIRTPLSAIARLLDLSLQSGPASDPQRSSIQAARDATRVLLELLEGMLTQSKLDMGKLILVPRPTDLATLAQEAMQLYAPSATDKGLRLLTRIDSPPTTVLCDDIRLRQILNNLLSNAIKYTPRGFVSLQLAWQQSDRGIHVEFLIGDSGIGMPPDLLSNLDTPFSNEGEAARRQYGGTGLGLCLTRRLTRLMNGDMSIDSEPELGTRIRLVFRFAPSERPTVAQHEPPHPYPAGLTALVVEDNPASQMLLARQLDNLGITVISCDDGLSALRCWADKRPDIIFCDVQLPALDGLQLCKRIRRLERRLMRAPAVLVCVSANTPPADDHPYDLVQNKPVSLENLRRALACCPGDPGGHEPPVDFNAVSQLAYSNEGFERHFIRTALNSLEKDSRQLQLARRRGDLPQLSACAHRLLGVTRLICNDMVNRHCKQLETAARNLNRSEVVALLPHVRQDIACVLYSLRCRLLGQAGTQTAQVRRS
jgi:signal transduction histidine kinase/CheY-like chemotaxis protein